MYFLEFPETKQLFNIFDKNNLEARFVGGCVRDGLCNAVTDDFDIAINCEINKLCDILENKGIRIIKTGIKYSSITVLINKIKYEITSLRRDTKCDGRYCCVSGISDFKQDAMRRDFTMNALYMDISGKLFDYFDGQRDLANKIVRFIGEPAQRIQEDYLRIFRYYRFCVKYGDFSNRYCEIIKHLSDNVLRLSIERIQAELIKILHYNGNERIFELMTNTGIIKINIELYKKLLNIYPDAKIILKLYALFGADVLLNKFHLPKYCKNIVKQYLKYKNEPLIYALYKTAPDIQQDIIILKSLDDAKLYNPPIKNVFPRFPIEYKDLCNIIQKPAKIIKLCERWWVLNNFKPNKEQCLIYIKNNLA